MLTNAALETLRRGLLCELRTNWVTLAVEVVSAHGFGVLIAVVKAPQRALESRATGRACFIPHSRLVHARYMPAGAGGPYVLGACYCDSPQLGADCAGRLLPGRADMFVCGPLSPISYAGGRLREAGCPTVLRPGPSSRPDCAGLRRPL